MLVGAGLRLGSNPGKLLGGNTAFAVERTNFNKSGALRCSLSSEAKTADAIRAGLPNGYEHPTAWCLPRRGGALTSYGTHILGTGGISEASLAMGRALTADLIGAGDITTADLRLIISLTAALAGDGDLSASMRGAVQLACDLAGSGDITAAIGLLTFMSAGLTGAGTMDGSAMRGTASLAANIVAFGDLTPEGLANAVWAATAALNNSAGTMGEKLNDAGSASNPWTEVIESGYTAAEIMRLLAAVAAGKTNIVDLGGGNAEVTIRDLADTKDRIVADMTGSERTTVTKDVT